MNVMILKPQDILVMLKLVAIGETDWSYNSLALALNMSQSEVHAAVKRATMAGLANTDADKTLPVARNLQEFIVHGLRFVFVPERGELTRGIPTLHAAPPLNGFLMPDGEPPPVWPDPQGSVRGMAFSPLYSAAPAAAKADSILYEWLVLVDAIRGGRARERAFASQEITKRLESYANHR